MLETLEAIEVIAQGGQGRVWLAYDRPHRRPLAVKVVAVTDVAAGDRLLAELAPVASRVARSPMVPILAYGRMAAAPESFQRAFGTPGVEQIYLLMAYVHGPNLRELAAAAGPFPIGAVAGLLGQLLTALAEMHPGELHLDLKPENILLDEVGRLAIVDHQLGTRLGTPGYAAPEQEAGQAGPESDIFAAGRIALCLWTGCFPDGPVPMELLAPPPVPPGASAHDRLLHERLEGLLRSTLVRNGAERPSANHAAIKALATARDLSDGEDVQASAQLRALRAGAKLPARLAAFEKRLAELAGGAAQPPATPAASPPAAARSQIFLALVAIAAVASAARYTWINQRLAPAPTALPSSSDLPPLHADPQIAARVLSLDESAPDGSGLFSYFVKDPAVRLVVRLKSGPIVWVEDNPQQQQLYKLALQPGAYRLQHWYDPFHIDDQQFEIELGHPLRLSSVKYGTKAPRR